jgi:hypothetical protein
MDGSTEQFDVLIRSGAQRLTGHQRRLFQVEVTNELCGGSARQAERRFGWGRETVETGLHELRHDVRCLENFAARGRPRSEEKDRGLADVLLEERDRLGRERGGFGRAAGADKGPGVASSVIATADVRAVGLCFGADPPGSWGTRLRCRLSCQAGGWTKTPAWEPVERGGDVVALVVPLGNPLPYDRYNLLRSLQRPAR